MGYANQIAQRPLHQQRGRFFALPEEEYLDLIQSGRAHIDVRSPLEPSGRELQRTLESIARINGLAPQTHDSNSF